MGPTKSVESYKIALQRPVLSPLLAIAATRDERERCPERGKKTDKRVGKLTGRADGEPGAASS